MNKSLLLRNELSSYLDNYLRTSYFKDYCPNGLQVEGKASIKKIVCGVTASKDLLEQAIIAKADAILVHHGWFWKNDDTRIVGQLRERIKLLMQHEINLFAYHLPLDAHSEIGNNVQLAKVLGITVTGQHPSNSLVWYGQIPKKSKIEDFTKHLEKKLDRVPLVLAKSDHKVKKIAWCTGAAQNYFKDAIELGVDVYLSGEVSEPTFHLASESGVAYISAGHHATERYGVQALGEHLQKKYGVEYQFIDIPNPV